MVVPVDDEWLIGDLEEELGLAPLSMPLPVAITDDAEFALCAAAHELVSPSGANGCPMRVELIEDQGSGPDPVEPGD